jgi:hypothetical protein
VLYSVGDDRGDVEVAAVAVAPVVETGGCSSLRLSVPAFESRDRMDHLRSRLNRPPSDRPRLLPDPLESELLLSADGTQLGRGKTEP